MASAADAARSFALLNNESSYASVAARRPHIFLHRKQRGTSSSRAFELVNIGLGGCPFVILGPIMLRRHRCLFESCHQKNRCSSTAALGREQIVECVNL